VERECDSDVDLVRSVAARDAEAMAALYDRYAGAVLATCLRILRNRAEAEELLADVFWELWSHPDRYDTTRGTVWAYLVVLARSRGIDRLRSGRTQRDLTVELQPEKHEPAPSIRSSLSSLSTPLSSPLDAALLGEQRRRIGAAMDLLNPDQRRAIELSFYDGLSHSEIAETLNEPLGTIKGRIRLGLIQLRDSLSESAESQGREAS
jgi:RNA polymerase sigma-70 factor, ECF subfamily